MASAMPFLWLLDKIKTPSLTSISFNKDENEDEEKFFISIRKDARKELFLDNELM